MRDASGVPKGGASFKVVPLGAMGYITAGIQFANDGKAVIGGDAAGAWVGNASVRPTKWTQLYEVSRVGSTYAASMANRSARVNSSYVDTNIGAYAVTIAPSDSSRIYMTCEADVLKSSDGGVTFTKIGGPFKMPSSSGVDGMRQAQRRMVVDNQNPNVMMVGTNENKVAYTINGTSMVTIATGANVRDTCHFVAFDPTSTVSGGIRQKWYYTVDGSGIYESTTGPAGTFSLMSGSPATPYGLIIDAAGHMWVPTATGVYRKPSGSSTFTSISALSGDIYNSVAVDPSNTNIVVACPTNGAPLWKSTDGGTTWQSWSQINLAAYPSSIKAFGRKDINGRHFPAEMTFHPTNGVLYYAHGTGISNCPVLPTSTSSPWIWYEDSAGIEELVVSYILCPPGGKPIVCNLDQGTYRIEDENKYVNVSSWANPDSAQHFGHAWTADWAPEDPNFIICNNYYSYDNTGYSTDGGKTWALFTGKHPGGVSVYGGQIVAQSKNDFYHFPSNNTRPAESHDGGATWTYLTIGTTPTSGDNGWGWTFWGPQHVICVDKTTGDVYAFNYGTAGAPGVAAWTGLWKRTASTGLWTQVFSGKIDPSSVNITVSGQLIAVPGQTGHLLYISDATISSQRPIMKSTNGGVSWTALSNTSLPSCIACGKAAPGASYPTIYYYGKYSGNFGIWRSVDAGATFQLHGAVADEFPGNYVYAHQVMAASLDVFGDVYFDNHNAGAAKAEYTKAFTVT